MTDSSGGSVSRRTFLTVSGAVLGGIAAGTEVTVAESEDRYLVDLDGTTMSEVASAAEAVIHELEAIDLAVVRGTESDLEAVTGKFEPDTVYELDLPSDQDVMPDAAGTDTDAADTDALLYPGQWDKQAQDVPAVHESTRGEGTRVTIIDTGVGTFTDGLLGPADDVFHPDLDVNTELSKNFTDDGGDAGDVGFHGTTVAGVVAAKGVGTLGSAPDTELVSCRVFGGSGGATFGDVVAAMNYSVDVDADAANLSLGAYPVSREGLGEFYGGVLNRTAARANSNGTLLVAAAGNDSADLQQDGDVVSLPNEAANTMSISATGPEGFSPFSGADPEEAAETPASYTNYGTNAIDVSAPGGDLRDDGSIFDYVLTTAPPLNVLLPYVYIAGTSFAAPQVAGAAALVRSVDPEAPPNKVRSVLERTAVDPKDVPGDRAFHGRGFLDPGDAVDAASKGGD